MTDWIRSTTEKLEDLLNLPSNWDTYNAQMIMPQAVFNARRLILCINRSQTNEPLVLPISDGSVSLEWIYGLVTLRIEIHDNGIFSAAYYSPSTEHEWSGQLNQHIRALGQLVSSLRDIDNDYTG